MFTSHSFFKSAILMRLSLSSVWRRLVCGWQCWLLSPSFMTPSYDFLDKHVTVVDPTWKTHSSANITGDCLWYAGNRFYCWGGLCSFFINNFSCLAVPLNPAPATWWSLIREHFTFFASSIRFSNWASSSSNTGSFGDRNTYHTVDCIQICT